MLTVNNKPLTDSRLAQWAKALAKAQAISNAMPAIIGRGKHPQTSAPFVVCPSYSGKKAGYSRVHYCFKTPSGYSCLCEAGQAGNPCWHAAAFMLTDQPALAAAITREAEAAADMAAADRARVAALPATSSQSPRVWR